MKFKTGGGAQNWLDRAKVDLKSYIRFVMTESQIRKDQDKFQFL